MRSNKTYRAERKKQVKAMGLKWKDLQYQGDSIAGSSQMTEPFIPDCNSNKASLGSDHPSGVKETKKGYAVKFVVIF